MTIENVDAEKANVTKQHVAGSALLINKQGGIRKLPVPSNNPNDPLNWKFWQKASVVFCCCWFCTYSSNAERAVLSNTVSQPSTVWP